jgi:hypothetical protein
LLANVLLDQDPVVVQGQENSALDVTGPFDIITQISSLLGPHWIFDFSSLLHLQHTLNH